jgi:GAF domain-containing protein
VVSIPLRVDDRPVGAIAIYKLLQQKDGFSALDNELFTLLAGHAATAIFASRLYGQSERKLSTIKGFIDLLTN